ncbi:pseudouridine synthase [Uliginosibacterium gangwonense]|uniref:pseudouridine synthase n=1 Tax=Uliginosibacterium gangwonense TaxID=392736 RepID=UPI000A00022D|nr:pseudouridine synthase [Uliginosibacterium gangwonense]
MTDSKPRRLSLPAKTEGSERETPRRPIRGANKALEARDGSTPRPRPRPRNEEERGPRRDDSRRPYSDARSGREGDSRSVDRSNFRRDERPIRPYGEDRPRFGDRPARPHDDAPRGEGRRFEGDRRPRTDSDSRSGDRSNFRRDERPSRPHGEDRPRFGDRPARSNDDAPRGEGRRSEGDRRPRTDSDSRSGDRSNFRRDERPSRPYGEDRPRFGDRRPDGDASRSEGRRFDGDRRPRTDVDSRTGERPSFRRDERPSRPAGKDRPRFGDRPARSHDDAPRGEGRRFDGDRRPRTDSDSRSGERPSFRRDERPSSPHGEDRPRFDDRRPAGDTPRGEGRRFSSDRRDEAPQFTEERRSPSRSPRFREEEDKYQRTEYSNNETAPREERKDWRSEWRPRQAERLPKPREDDQEGSVRLSKRMTELGLCSRREADEYIERGWVKVDGVVVDQLGSKVQPEQKIELSIQAESAQNQRITILINKPIGYVSGQAEDGYEPASVLVTNENHWEEDPCKIRIESRFLRKLAPAGRLDIDSTGLLVLTQDGRVAKQIIGERSEVEKEYLVRVEGNLSAEGMKMLNHGLELDGVELMPAKVSWQNEDQLRFVLREGRKRQIRRMCELVGLRVVGLKRIRIGRVTLSKLPVGMWRYLGEHEVF